MVKLILSLLLSFTNFEGYRAAGDFAIAFSAQDFGIAGANLFDPGLAPKNPAVTGLLNGFYVDFNFSFITLHEARKVFVYDQFNNTVGEMTAYSKYTSDFAPTGLSITYAKNHFGLATFYFAPADFSYKFERVERSDAYTQLSHEIIKNQGNIKLYGVAFSYNWKNLFLGSFVALTEGFKENYYFYRQDTTVTIQADTVKTSGLYTGFGILYKWGYRAEFTFVYHPEFKKEEGSSKFVLPESFDFGILLKPMLRYPSRIFFRVQNVQMAKSIKNYKNYWHFFVGTESVIFPGIKLLFGASLRKSYRLDLWVPYYSFGISNRLAKGLWLTVSGLISPVSYKAYVHGKRYNFEEDLSFIGFGLSFKH